MIEVVGESRVDDLTQYLITDSEEIAQQNCLCGLIVLNQSMCLCLKYPCFKVNVVFLFTQIPLYQKFTLSNQLFDL